MIQNQDCDVEQRKDAGFQCEIDKLYLIFQEKKNEIENWKIKSEILLHQLNEKNGQEIDKLIQAPPKNNLEWENQTLRKEIKRMKGCIHYIAPKDKVSYDEYISKLKEELQNLKIKYNGKEVSENVKNGDQHIVKKDISLPVEIIIEKTHRVYVDNIIEKIVEIPKEVIKYVDYSHEMLPRMSNEISMSIRMYFDEFLTEYIKKRLIVDDSIVKEIESHLNMNNNSSQK